ncbi:hypothetical protein F4782DRAFT_466534 [Xylaria castorea]|nr:hypothetical protein F4782DRAFT_466534 [Xylaria castorea]
MAHPATDIVISTIVFSILALISVALRFLVRIKQRAGLAYDDFLLLPALLFTLGLGACTVIEVYIGHIGQRVTTNSKGIPQYGDWLRHFFEIEWLGLLISMVAFTLIKASLVLFYRRIFRGNHFYFITTVLLGTIYSWGISFFLAILLQCKPISQALLPPMDRTGSCYSPIPVVEAMAIANLILDIAILAIPQPIVWKLQMPLKQRVAVSFIFLLGFIVIGIGGVRVYYYFDVNGDPELKSNYDVPYVSTPALYWTSFDAFVAIICASLPTLNSLLSSLSPGLIIRSIASKIPIRSFSKKSWNNNLPKWEGRPREDSTSSAHRLSKPFSEAIHMSSLDITDEGSNRAGSSDL